MQSSGWTTSVSGTTGTIQVQQSFGYVVGWCYTYWPAATLNASSTAGWYLTNMNAAATGVVYNYIYTSGQPILPTVLPALMTTYAGAAVSYTQQTAVTLNCVAASIPANLMGINGAIEFDATWANSGTTGATIGAILGATGYALAVGIATNTTARTNTILRNRGVTNAQVANNIFNSGSFSPFSGVNRYSTIDTTVAQTAAHQLQVSGINQWVICESYSIRLIP
jgi:hypothetical protein